MPLARVRLGASISAIRCPNHFGGIGSLAGPAVSGFVTAGLVFEG
jgi:hypothetical protein